MSTSSSRPLTAPADAFPVLRSEIAGLPVHDLAAKFGTPLYVYDAAKIVERIDDLRAFDTIRYAQKANSNLAILDLVRRQGVLVDAVSAGESRPRLGRRLSRPWRSAADRLHGRYLRSRVARPGRRAGHPRQLRLARHDRPVGRAGAGPRDHAADQSRLRPRPQPENQHRRRTIEARHLARAARRLPAPRRPARPDRSPGCTCTSARAPIWSISRRSAGRWKSWPRLRAARSRRSAPAAACRSPIGRANRTSISTPISSLWDATRQRLGSASATASASRSSRAATWSPRAAIWSPKSAPSSGWAQHVLPARRRLQQSGPADSLRRLPPDVDRAAPSGAGTDRPLADVVVGGPLCESGDIFTQNRRGLRRHARAAGGRRSATCLVIECAGAYGVRDGLELQLQAAGGRGADPLGPCAPGAPAAIVRGSDPRRVDSDGRVVTPAALKLCDKLPRKIGSGNPALTHLPARPRIACSCSQLFGSFGFSVFRSSAWPRSSPQPHRLRAGLLDGCG